MVRVFLGSKDFAIVLELFQVFSYLNYLVCHGVNRVELTKDVRNQVSVIINYLMLPSIGDGFLDWP